MNEGFAKLLRRACNLHPPEYRRHAEKAVRFEMSNRSHRQRGIIAARLRKFIALKGVVP